jgi:hypothetical protein
MRTCAFYKERENFVLITTGIITATLSRITDNSVSNLLSMFEKVFNSRAFTGRRSILKIDRDEFKAFNLKCLNTIVKILPSLHHIALRKTLRNLKTAPVSLIDIKGKTYTLQVSCYNWLITEGRLDFYVLNNYIYNRASGTDYPGLVLSLPDETFFDITDSNTETYTNIRGLATRLLRTRSRVQGQWCHTCENSCKPKYIKGLERLMLTR